MNYFFPITAELVAPLNLRPASLCDSRDTASSRTDTNAGCRNVASVASPPVSQFDATDCRNVSDVASPLTLKNAAWWRDLFEERAAIREHDGGLTRAEAEAGALADLAAHWRALNPLLAGPASGAAACVHCGGPGPDTPVLAPPGHAWLHRTCWAPMNLAREREALAAVRAMLDGTPRRGPLAG